MTLRYLIQTLFSYLLEIEGKTDMPVCYEFCCQLMTRINDILQNFHKYLKNKLLGLAYHVRKRS